MLACGTGIAPMVQVARAIVENDAEDTFVRCLYCCRTQHDILCKKQLDFFSSFWNFTILYVLSGVVAGPDSITSDPGAVQYGDNVHYRHLDRELVSQELLKIGKGQSQVLICGTKSFDKDMINYIINNTGHSYFKF